MLASGQTLFLSLSGVCFGSGSFIQVFALLSVSPKYFYSLALAPRQTETPFCNDVAARSNGVKSHRHGPVGFFHFSSVSVKNNQVWVWGCC